jgi:hypothetical protein
MYGLSLERGCSIDLFMKLTAVILHDNYYSSIYDLSSELVQQQNLSTSQIILVLAQDRDRWRAPVTTSMKLSIDCWEGLTSMELLSYGFMTWCLIKHSDNLSLSLFVSLCYDAASGSDSRR